MRTGWRVYLGTSERIFLLETVTDRDTSNSALYDREEKTGMTDSIHVYDKAGTMQRSNPTDAIHVVDKAGTIVAWATRDCVTGEVRLATQCGNARRTINTLQGQQAWDAVCKVLQQLQEAMNSK